MNDQTKTRTTLIECFKGLKKALKDSGIIFTNIDETNITSVSEVPGLETYTSEEDIKLIKKMDSMREKIRMSKKSVEEQIENPSTRRKNMKFKVVQKELEK